MSFKSLNLHWESNLATKNLTTMAAHKISTLPIDRIEVSWIWINNANYFPSAQILGSASILVVHYVVQLALKVKKQQKVLERWKNNKRGPVQNRFFLSLKPY